MVDDEASLLVPASDDAVSLLMDRGYMPLLAMVCSDVVSLLFLRGKVSLLRGEVSSLLLVCDDVASSQSGIRSVDGSLVCFFMCTGQVCVCRLGCMSDRASPTTTNHKSVPLIIARKQVHACP